MALAGCADEAGPEKSTGVVGQADTPESEATSEATAALDALQRGATAPIAVRWSRFGTAQTLQGALGVRLPATSAGEARRAASSSTALNSSACAARWRSSSRTRRAARA
jgi:hypothetical protein